MFSLFTDQLHVCYKSNAVNSFLDVKLKSKIKKSSYVHIQMQSGLMLF